LNENSKKTNNMQVVIQIIEEKKPKTVQELVNSASETLKISEQEAMELVLKLQKEGKVRLERETLPTPQKLTSYLRTEDALWYWVTVIFSLGTAVVAFTVPEDLYPWVFVRYVSGSIFVLWLPGYTFVKALFPTQVPIKLQTESLDALERIALSLGLSLALVPIVGFLLNYTVWGVKLTTTVMSLLVLTVFCATVALTREHQEKMKNCSL
jgi:hypothetical protein